MKVCVILITLRVVPISPFGFARGVPFSTYSSFRVRPDALAIHRG